MHQVLIEGDQQVDIFAGEAQPPEDSGRRAQTHAGEGLSDVPFDGGEVATSAVGLLDPP